MRDDVNDQSGQPANGEGSPPASPRSRFLKIALICSVPVLLWGAFQLFLCFGLEFLLNLRPERVQVSYDTLWMSRPGRVHVRGLHLRGSNPRVRWEVTLDRGAGDIAVLALASRELRVSKLRAQGLELDIHKNREGGARGSSRKRPWVFRFEDAEVEDVRKVRLGRRTWSGRGEGGGDFLVQPRTAFGFDSAYFRSESGAIERAGREEARNLTLDLSGNLSETNPKGLTAKDLFAHAHVEVEASGRARDLRFLNAWLEGLPTVRFEQGAGRLQSSIEWDRGEIVPGGYLRVQAEGVGFRYLHYLAEGDATIEWESRRTEEGVGIGSLTTVFERMQLRHSDAVASHATGGRLRVLVTSPDLAPLDGLDRLELHLSLEEAVVEDFALYNIYLPPTAPFEWESGRARLDGVLRADKSSGEGQFTLAGTNVRARHGELILQGEFELRTQIRDIQLEDRHVDLSGTTIRIENVETWEAGRGPSEKRERWWADLTLEDAHVWPHPALRLDAKGNATLKDTKPILAIFAEERRFLKLLSPLLKVKSVRAQSRFQLDESGWSLTGMTAQGDGLDTKGCLRSMGNDQDGAFFARRGRLRAAIEILNGERDAKIVAPERWFRYQGICPAIEAGKVYP